jgi:hypothetical protein
VATTRSTKKTVDFIKAIIISWWQLSAGCACVAVTRTKKRGMVAG